MMVEDKFNGGEVMDLHTLKKINTTEKRKNLKDMIERLYLQKEIVELERKELHKVTENYFVKKKFDKRLLIK